MPDLRFASGANSAAYYSELRQAFTVAGCPFCRLMDKAANSYIDSMLWGMVNDPRNQEPIKESRGYCHHHSWMMVRGGAALGITILAKSVIDTLLEVLNQHIGQQTAGGFASFQQVLNFRPNAAAKLLNDLLPQAPCPVCQAIDKIEQGYIHTLLSHMTGPDSLAEVYGASQGLCLPHLRGVVAKAKPGAALTNLLTAQREVWQRLNDELAEFTRKNDYRFAHEPVGEEGNAWQRGLTAISGAPPQTPGRDKQGLTSGKIK